MFPNLSTSNRPPQVGVTSHPLGAMEKHPQSKERRGTTALFEMLVWAGLWHIVSSPATLYSPLESANINNNSNVAYRIPRHLSLGQYEIAKKAKKVLPNFFPIVHLNCYL